jgi:hypothetical protein
METRSKGRSAGPIIRIILKAASSSEIPIALNVKLPNEPISHFAPTPLNQQLATVRNRFGPKNEPISGSMSAPRSSRKDSAATNRSRPPAPRKMGLNSTKSDQIPPQKIYFFVIHQTTRPKCLKIAIAFD